MVFCIKYVSLQKWLKEMVFPTLTSPALLSVEEVEESKCEDCITSFSGISNYGGKTHAFYRVKTT